MAIDINNIITLSTTIEVEESEEGLTAYAVYRLMKDVFDSLGVPFVNSNGKEIPSQQVYNDSRNGSINGVKGAGSRRYSEDEAMYYIAKQLRKHGFVAPTT